MLIRTSITQAKKTALTSSVLFGIVGIAYWLYADSFGEAANYDDIPNLQGLSGIHDFRSALTFVFSGEAGPLGRPIALATFAAQYYNWPHNLGGLVSVNVLIHLLNGLLVAWFGLRLCRSVKRIPVPPVPFAVTLFSLWILHPLLASSSLLIIQRMATLSATFVLLGLIGYLAGRNRLLEKRPTGRALMVGSLGVGTLMAMFTKESGALLPAYIWVLEYTLLDPARKLRLWRSFLHFPPLVLLAYLAARIPNLFDVGPNGFSGWQRLLTEGPILWRYLQLIFIPTASRLGPFHDDVAIVGNLAESPEAILAWLAWLAIGGSCVILRRSFPWYSFAVGWFLTGHALESTVLILEPYFEHRNYLPSIGPLAGLCRIVWTVPLSYRRMATIAITAYIAILAFVLHEVTAAWGNPVLASRLWAERQTGSERAQQFLAQRYILAGSYEQALSTIEVAAKNIPGSAGLELQKIQVACAFRDDIPARVSAALPVLIHARTNYAAIDCLKSLIDLGLEHKCPGLGIDNLHLLIDTLLLNSNYQRNKSTAFNLHQFKSYLHYQSRQLDPAVQHLEQAFEVQPDLDTGMLMIYYLESAGLRTDALAKLNELRRSLPSSLVLKHLWTDRLLEMEKDLLQSDIKRTQPEESKK